MSESKPKPNWRPTKESFEADPRSIALRNICLQSINAAEAAVIRQGDDAEVIKQIMDLNRELYQMGIRPEMHVIGREDPDADEKRQRLKEDPVMLSEWVAGQVMTSLEVSATATPVDPANFSEHDMLDGGGGSKTLVEVDRLPANVQEFMVNYALIGSLKGFLDYAAGPTELPQTKEQRPDNQ